MVRIGASAQPEAAHGVFCSEYSCLAEEQLFGTARPIHIWLLIEHRGRWEHQAADCLPPAARAVVDELKSRSLRVRFGLIRQTGRNSGPLAGFVALSREVDSRLYRFEIERLEDLPSMDIAGLIANSHNGDKLREQALFLVCTHGVHDRCCSKFGGAVYETMTRTAGSAAWQVTHVGGCRFAPNLVCLPHGVMYGRVQDIHCRRLTHSYHAGLMECSHLRGRSCYSKPVQAAEYFLRVAQQRKGLDDLRFAGAEEVGPREWRVVFSTAHSGESYKVHLASQEAPAATFKSCSAADPLPRQRFRLVESSLSVSIR